jgi:multicomponent Na+:H+ antiporter subunit G
MTGWEVASVVLLVIGAVFFLAGTLGLLRFPDVYTRLHALTKADNLGLGFVVAGLAIDSADLARAARLVGIWGLVLLSSSINCQLIARAALGRGVRPWSERDAR